ncbi:hypothetical protein V6C03_06720 [Methyloligella sp. 2.7D]|uniref:hypothetical protein n=1 Tax=unclassified Methyloligella TaxID=2625955 RepID=UPI00157DD3D3|nr:hypothetical protein [Methyloligella sp. GL2]QKP78408.1 hypothetical protein HT051_13725 [Methyloligella sp. GL2]
MAGIFKTSALAAALLGFAAMAPAPASAGSFGLMVTPSGDTAKLIRSGLQIYAMAEQHESGSRKKNRARVEQRGKRNASAIGQKGRNNNAFVVQNGDDHRANVRQAGRNNTLGVFQFGRGTDLDIGQYGRNQTGLVFLGGW